jgi:hypothetical protein
MKKTQAGFAAIEAILILVILSIIGGVGYYVLHSANTANKNLSNVDSSSATKTKIQAQSIKSFDECSKDTGSKIQQSYPEVCTTKDGKRFTQPVPDEITANWLLYTSPGKEFSIRIADGWHLIHPSHGITLVGFNVDDITYRQGVKAQVEVQDGGRDGPIPFELLVVGKDGYDKLSTSGDKATGFQTNQGLTVEKYVYTQTSEAEGPGLPKGGRAYEYVISNDSKSIVVYHDESPGDPNNIEMVEKVVKTLEL